MKNTSSLFLTLVSYLIMLATILIMLFAAMPLPLKAQTNAEMVATNVAVTNATVPAVVEKSQAAQAPPAEINIPGIHIGSANTPEGETFTSVVALMIPIIAIVMGCSIPIVIVGLAFYFRHRKNQMLHETVRTMVEKGVPIPPEMFQKTEHEFMEHDKPRRPRNDLRNGLLFVGIGIGMVLLAGKVGYIILFMGVAFVVTSFLENKNKSDDQPPKQ